METLAMFAIIMISQIVFCAGIISAVELLRDIRDALEEDNNNRKEK